MSYSLTTRDAILINILHLLLNTRGGGGEVESEGADGRNVIASDQINLGVYLSALF